jgi:hypothetical protein
VKFDSQQIEGLARMKVSKILGVVCVLFTAVAGRAANPNVTISVDATTAPRKIFHATLKIPATLAT